MRRVVISLMLAPPGWAQESHPILPLGSPAPNFELLGVDGAIHRLADYSSSPVLGVMFTCNHFPIPQMYERGITQLVADLKGRSVALSASLPNDPKAISSDELECP